MRERANGQIDAEYVKDHWRMIEILDRLAGDTKSGTKAERRFARSLEGLP